MPVYIQLTEVLLLVFHFSMQEPHKHTHTHPVDSTEMRNYEITSMYPSDYYDTCTQSQLF